MRTRKFCVGQRVQSIFDPTHKFHIEDLYNLIFPRGTDVNGHLCMVFQCFFR
jgi:hypothetical protein